MAKYASTRFVEALLKGFNADTSALDTILEGNDVVDFVDFYESTAVKSPYSRASFLSMKGIFPRDTDLLVLPNPYGPRSFKRLSWAFDAEVVDFESTFSIHTRSHNPDVDGDVLQNVVSIEPAILDATSRKIVRKGKIIVKS